jgi:hypothetical protein
MCAKRRMGSFTTTDGCATTPRSGGRRALEVSRRREVVWFWVSRKGGFLMGCRLAAPLGWERRLTTRAGCSGTDIVPIALEDWAVLQFAVESPGVTGNATAKTAGRRNMSDWYFFLAGSASYSPFDGVRVPYAQSTLDHDSPQNSPMSMTRLTSIHSRWRQNH